MGLVGETGTLLLNIRQGNMGLVGETRTFLLNIRHENMVKIWDKLGRQEHYCLI